MGSTKFSIIELEQGTPEWIEWRHKGIGASDAPIIMEENPWKSSVELLREKRDPARDSKKNEAMSHGIIFEPEARACYTTRTGNIIKPACLQNTEIPWLRASVDGISSDSRTIVEIKCGESVYQHTSDYACVPDYYYGQLQHILAVSGLESIDFWCYLPDYPELLLTISRDEEYIKRLLIVERIFWNKVQKRTGFLGWLFGIRRDTTEKSTKISNNMKYRTEITNIPEGCKVFSGIIAGVPVQAEVPVELKANCDKLLCKLNRTSYDNEYLHNNYWVNVYYKGQRHGYHGVSDIWTYSARELPEFISLYDWVYSILGKKKAVVNGNISTTKIWEEDGTICALGTYNSLSIQIFFKPKGFVLNFELNDNLRWKDKCSYNTKTGNSDFPYYYSSAQPKIIEWATEVFQQKRVMTKKTK